MSSRKKEVLIFSDIDSVSDFAVKKWIEICHETIGCKGWFEVALSGGTNPVNLYKKLSSLGKLLPWRKTHIFLVDERFVPYGDKDSNFRMINQTLLRHVDIPKKNVHSIPILKTPQASARKYEGDLISHFKLAKSGFPQFDLVLLGVGMDGHTASLFPDAPVLNETRHMAVAVSPGRDFRRERITITLPVINNAKNIIFFATGVNKADIIKEILEKRNSILPSARVKPKTGRLYFLLDKNAASYLK